MKSNWNLKLITQFAGVAALAGSITIALPYIVKERNAEAQKPQQQRYVISRPERCSDIVNGGIDHQMGEYLFCETPDGYSLFHKVLKAKNWEERQYK